MSGEVPKRSRQLIDVIDEPDSDRVGPSAECRGATPLEGGGINTQPFPQYPPQEIEKEESRTPTREIEHPPNISGTAQILERLEQKLQEYLLLDDGDALVVLLGAVAAFKMGRDPVWLLLVAPPSGAKTELLKLLKSLEEVVWLSTLTPKTLASGYGGTTDASLLNDLDEKIVVFKDLTTVLQMRRDDQREILAQLREIYDGQFDKAWGTGKTLNWTGRIGFVAGVTHAIDKQHSVMGLLGPRFVFLRIHQPDREAAAERAIANSPVCWPPGKACSTPSSRNGCARSAISADGAPKNSCPRDRLPDPPGRGPGRQ